MNVDKYNYKKELINHNNNQQNIKIQKRQINRNWKTIKCNKVNYLLILDQNKISKQEMINYKCKYNVKQIKKVNKKKISLNQISHNQSKVKFNKYQLI